MARAGTATLLPLDRFAATIGINPLHFNQVFVPDVPVCEDVIYQHDWQHPGRAGREGIATAIRHAEERLSEVLGFKPKPVWIEDEQYSLSARTSGKWNQIPLQWKRYLAGGIESKVLIAAGRPVVYTGSNHGYAETATITVNTSVANIEEIAVFYPGKAGADGWEIKPVTVSYDVGTSTATIVCRREQLLVEDLQEDFAAEAEDGTVDASFLGSVDVYRRFHDPQRQIQFLWAHGCLECSGVGCGGCAYTDQYGCLLGRDMKLGFVTATPGVWDTADNEFDFAEWAVREPPRRARLWYRAGWKWEAGPRPHVDMDPRFERAISLFALTLLDAPICTCVDAAYEKWNAEYGKSESTNEGGFTYKFSKQLLENPLGSRAGAVEAWRLIRDML